MYLRSLLIALSISWAGASMAHNQATDDRGFEGQRAAPGASMGRLTLPDGRAATILAHESILAKETRLPSYMDITLRQVTDGRRVVQAVLGRLGQIMDCHISMERTDISTFTHDFQRSQQKLQPDKAVVIPRARFTDRIKDMVDLSGLVERCQSYQDRQYQTALKNAPQNRRSKRSLVWPGTKWCGKGDDASSFKSLGTKSMTDRCCRLHDQCPYYIEGFRSKYGVFNFRFHTVSHCDCDFSFRTCLRTVNSGTANMIGSIYFNVVSLPCFVFVPRKTCLKRAWWGRCQKHALKYQAEVKAAVTYHSGL